MSETGNEGDDRLDETSISAMVPLRPEPHHVAQTLLVPEQWLVARKLKPGDQNDKRPLEPTDRSATDELMSFTEAKERAEALRHDSRLPSYGATILGFVPTPEDRILGWDLDKVRDPSVGDASIPDFVWELVADIGGYWQVSISGTGLRGFSFGANEFAGLLEESGSMGDLPIDPVLSADHPQIELYDQGQYLSVSGAAPLTHPSTNQTLNQVTPAGEGTRTIIETYLSSTDESPRDPDESEQADLTMFGGRSNQSSPQHTSRVSDSEPQDNAETSNSFTSLGKRRAKQWTSRSKSSQETFVGKEPKSSEQVIQTALKKASSDFQKLWEGEDINNDDSDSDRLFLLKLAFWTQKDQSLMEEIFRESGRYNCRRGSSAKFDSRDHGEAGEGTWGEYMIKEAIKDQPDEFSGRYVEPTQ